MNIGITWSRARRPLLISCSLLAAIATAHGQVLTGKDLLSALRAGGCVIVMRHASSPREPPDAAHADRANVNHERQLDEAGRKSARAMGEALRRLQIPIGHVLSSPTYRALETVRLARVGKPETDTQLGDAGQSMQADTSGRRGAWLKMTVAVGPAAGTNTVIVTHFPNMREAFGDAAAGLGDGEALIFRPDGSGDAALVGRMKISDWAKLPAGRLE